MTNATRLLDGKYEFLEKLGEGGMGALYKVRHALLDEVRVIKVLRPQFLDHDHVRARFVREARIASQVRHPNIAQLYDFSIDEAGMAHIVMEFIDGVTLKEVLRHTGALPVDQALEIARQALRALGHLHGAGIVHRDVSPDNIMLARGPEGDVVVKLIDLGIAKILEGGSEAGLTETGMFVGKVHYASPESFGDQVPGAIDARSDLYSFGVVLYELMTGRHPIAGESAESLIAGHLYKEPIDFAVSDPDNRVPPEVRGSVSIALAKQKVDRPESAERFSESLGPERYPCPPEDLAATFETARARKLASAPTQSPSSPMFEPSTVVGPPPLPVAASRSTPAADGHPATVPTGPLPVPEPLVRVPGPSTGAAGKPLGRSSHLGIATGAFLFLLLAALYWWNTRPEPPEKDDEETAAPSAGGPSPLAEELRRLESDGTDAELRLDGVQVGSPRVHLGRPLGFRLRSRRGGFLVLFGIQPDGTLHCFYPNSVRRSLEAEAGGDPLALPLPADRRAGLEIFAGEPLGRDVVFALLTTERPPELPEGDTSNLWLTTYRNTGRPGDDPARAFTDWVSDLRRRDPAGTSLVSVEFEVISPSEAQ